MARQLNIRIDEKTFKQIKREAKKLRLDNSRFVRRLIFKYFTDQEIRESQEGRA